jgi:hypothetical protein
MRFFKKWFVIWHYFVWQLFWLLFKKLGNFFSNHPVTLLPLHLQAKEFLSFEEKSEDICFQQKIF